MANENPDRSELDKLLRKRKLSIDNVDKEIFPLVDHFIAKERTHESEIDCETLLETILDTESEVTELSYRIQDLMLDNNELSEYLKNSTAFNMKLKISKRKLQKFLEYHPESSVPVEIRRDARRNDGVKLPKIVLRKFIGDPLDWNLSTRHSKQLFIVVSVLVILRSLPI